MTPVGRLKAELRKCVKQKSWKEVQEQHWHMTRDNAALENLFFEILQDLGLVQTVPPWYSPVKPKPVYKMDNAQAFWDAPLSAEH